MDFIKILPDELSEMIFQYLTVEELLAATLVSKTWNSFIGESLNLMRNIKLVFKARKPLPADYTEILAGSQRIYQHLAVSGVDAKFMENINDIFESKINQLKTLKLKCIHFTTTKNIADFIGLFQSTLEEVELDEIVVDSVEAYSVCEFERLKVLILRRIDFNINCSSLFTNCKRLTEFRITSTSFTIQYIRPVVKLLTQNDRLKVLEISLPIYDLLLTNYAIKSCIPFKLHTFVASNRYSTWSPENFDEFLMTQYESLQTLSLQQVTHVENLETIFRMPKLREVDLGDVEKLCLKGARLSVNGSIERLTFLDMNNQLSTIRAIVSAAPNVRELKIYSMTQESMELVSRALRGLEALTMRTIDAVELSNVRLFPKLRRCAIEIIASDLEDHMEALPVESRSALVRLILSSNSYIILH